MFSWTGGKIATLRKGGHSGSVFCLSLNDDVIVSGSFDHTICVWDRQNMNGKSPLIKKLNQMGIQHSDMIYGVAINVFNQIVSCSHDSTVSLWQYNKKSVSRFINNFVRRYLHQLTFCCKLVLLHYMGTHHFRSLLTMLPS